MDDMDETIAAVATAFGQGAVSMVRVSGPQARPLFEKCWRGRRLDAPRHVVWGRITHPGDAAGETVIDDGLAVFFPGPASYTGEDVVEFTGHGGILVTRRVLEAVLAAGARLAEPGEFTQRAFLHGKMDLTQAEAVMDVIGAQTDLALRAAREQLSGRLGTALHALRTQILELLAHVEAFIDFPEEDIDPDTGAELAQHIAQAQSVVLNLLATADQGRILREGVATAIAGAPNVGKSSLLNRMLGFERAIVSESAGTTRDTLEEVINLRGVPLRLIDTAGLRDAVDAIERAGIARSHAALGQAGLILEVADGSTARAASPVVVPPGTPHLRILNKSDLGEHPSWSGDEDAVRVSCATGAGFESLADAIESLLLGAPGSWPVDLVAINTRHQQCLERARDGLDAARSLLTKAQPPELVAEELRHAMVAVGEVVGPTDPEELLGVIFGRFCIGK